MPGLSATLVAQYTQRESSMNWTLIALVCLALLIARLVQVCAQTGAGIEWEVLNGETMALYRRGHYDRALPVAQKALAIAEEETAGHYAVKKARIWNISGV
jgi:hypothetical protein